MPRLFTFRLIGRGVFCIIDSVQTGKTAYYIAMSTKGFTLVELAIALLVIGILIGGVLKGLELVENAKIVTTINRVAEYKTATIIFRKRYRALPGDTNQPARISGCNSAPCTNPGNNDRMLVGETERMNYWLQLGRAGLLGGLDGNATTRLAAQPRGPYGGTVMVNYIDQPQSGTWRRFRNNYYAFVGANEMTQGVVPVFAAHIIDQKADDGFPRSGDVRTINGDETCVDEAANRYMLGASAACPFWVKM